MINNDKKETLIIHTKYGNFETTSELSFNKLSEYIKISGHLNDYESIVIGNYVFRKSDIYFIERMYK